MAPMPTELKLEARIDVQCARCAHPGALVRYTLPVLGVTMVTPAGGEPSPLPVVDVRVGALDVELECESCHQTVRWRSAVASHDFPDTAYPVPADQHAEAARHTAAVERERMATADASDFPADPDAEHHRGA